MGGQNSDSIEVNGKILPDFNGDGIHAKYVTNCCYSSLLNNKISLSQSSIYLC